MFPRTMMCRAARRAPLLAAAVATLLGASAPTVLAQSRTTATRPDQAPPVGTRRPPAQQTVPATPLPPAADGEPRDAAVEDAPDPAHVNDLRLPPPRYPAVDVNGEPIEDGADADADVRAQRQPGDGHLAIVEPEPIQDGIAPSEQPQAIIDGSLEALEEAGHADLELEHALREREALGRPLEQRRYGPYQPIGIRVGSFVLFPSAEAGLAGTDNVFRSATNRKSDMFADALVGGTMQSNWRRHAVEFRIQNARSFHQEFTRENYNRLDAQARARLDISRRTNIVGDVSYSYGQEVRGAVNTPTTATGERSVVIQRRAGAEVNHRENRLLLRLRGGISDFTYGTVPVLDPATGIASAPALNGRNYTQHEVGGRAGWQFNPNLILYSDLVLNNRRHETLAADGTLRNSDGYRLQGGAAFDQRGKLQGEISAGWGSQTPDDPRLKTVSGFIYNGRLNWQPTGLTEVIVTALSDIGETTTAGSGGALIRSTGIEVRHALRRHLILIAGASYSVASYGGLSLKEANTAGRLGLEYHLSREMALLAQYQHTKYDTNGGSSGYDENAVRVSMRVRQ